MILIDCNFLIAWSSSKTSADDLARLEHLAEDVHASKKKIIIPTPVLAEFLVKTDESTAEWLNALEKKSFIKIASFDRRAAFECAQMDRAALANGGKKGLSNESWQKVKIDRQIVAIGKLHAAELVISSDSTVRSNAITNGIKAMTIQELPIPESSKQMPLQLVQDKAIRKDG